MSSKQKKAAAKPGPRSASSKSRTRGTNTRRSLLSPKATGGLRAWKGFRVQTRYIALRLGEWLQDAAFSAFQPERAEDVDVRFGSGTSTVRDYHQVKSGDVRPATVGEIVRGFKIETGARSIRRLVIASPHLDAKVRSLVQALDRFRSSDFEADAAAQASTRTGVASLIRTLKLDDLAEFILEHVEFYQDFGTLLGGREADPRSAYERIANELHRHGPFRSFNHGELAHAARQIVASIDDGGSRTWTRAQLLELVRSSVEEFRAGPPLPRGDVLLVRHDSVARTSTLPERSDLPDLFKDRRVLPVVDLDQTALVATADLSGVPDAVRDLAETNGRFRAALAVPNTELLYFGLPHVPLAALAGYVARQHRHIHLVEHDRGTGRFQWEADAVFPPLTVTETRRDGGSLALVRVSISAEVLQDSCGAVVSPAQVRLDLDFRLPPGTGGRGVVKSEAQARAYAERIRRSLDMSVAGHLEFAAVHVFAAVPVSVAFLLGQALSGTGLPETWIHNYRHEDRPAYKWSVGLHAADRGDPGAVRVVTGE